MLFPAGPAPQVLAATVCRSTGGVLLPSRAFPGHLPWHKTCLHLICGPARRLHRHTKKLGQLEKLPRAQCQVCDHCYWSCGREYEMLTDLSCSARATALREVSGSQAAESKLSLFVLTSSDRESVERSSFSWRPCRSLSFRWRYVFAAPRSTACAPSPAPGILTRCSTSAGLIFQKILHKQLKC